MVTVLSSHLYLLRGGRLFIPSILVPVGIFRVPGVVDGLLRPRQMFGHHTVTLINLDRFTGLGVLVTCGPHDEVRDLRLDGSHKYLGTPNNQRIKVFIGMLFRVDDFHCDTLPETPGLSRTDYVSEIYTSPDVCCPVPPDLRPTR